MSRTDQNLKDAISCNEKVALWCAGAVIFGLVLEVFFVAWFHEPPETFLSRWGPVGSDVIVALGVAGEVFFGRKSRIDSEELTRRSEDKLSDATKSASDAVNRAAQAELETQRLRAQFAGRHITQEQVTELSHVIRDRAASLDVLIEFQASDAEAFLYGFELMNVFKSSGVEKIRFTGNGFISGMVFGLWLFTSPEFDVSDIREAFRDAGIPLSAANRDLSTHLSRNEVAPNLYI